MTLAEFFLRSTALFLGLFCALSGLNFWIVGVAPGRSAPWWKQNLWAVAFLVIAFGCLRYLMSS